MAGKRQATSDLNHDNWDREEEPEERGSFRTASEEELKNRIIKKAKRKIAPNADNDIADGGSGTKSVFSGFSGFRKPPAAAATPASSSPFSFLSKIPAIAATTSGVVSSSKTTTSATATFSFGIGSSSDTTIAKNTETAKTSLEIAEINAASSANKSSSSDSESSGCSEYYKNLSSLNQAVCEWIKTHVDKNPVCILSPIFKDYEKYLEKIENEKKNETKNVNAAKTADELVKTASGTDLKGFKFSISDSNDAVSTNYVGTTSTISQTASKTNGFTLTFKTQNDTSAAKPSETPSFRFNLNPSTTSVTPITTSSTSFSFGNQSTEPPKPFSFTPGGTPFSFGNIKPPANNIAVGEQNDEEDEVPPKNEFKQVVESNAVYSKKCKVFVKKGENFVDRGVGTLYLKPVESSGKTQLLVRADTNLGNILVNLILNSAVPAQRMGKNNVMMVCLPTPETEKPTSMLLRVKTSEEADELLENIDKYKK